MLNGTLEFSAQSTGNGAIDPDTNAFEPTGPYAVALVVVALVNMWISFALCAKRLHDRPYRLVACGAGGRHPRRHDPPRGGAHAAGGAKTALVHCLCGRRRRSL